MQIFINEKCWFSKQISLPTNKNKCFEKFLFEYRLSTCRYLYLKVSLDRSKSMDIRIGEHLSLVIYQIITSQRCRLHSVNCVQSFFICLNV